MGRAGDLFGESHDLVRGEKDHLLLGRTPESSTEYWVVLDRSGTDRQRHHESENVADVAHRAWPIARRGQIREERQHARMVNGAERFIGEARKEVLPKDRFVARAGLRLQVCRRRLPLCGPVTKGLASPPWIDPFASKYVGFGSRGEALGIDLAFEGSLGLPAIGSAVPNVPPDLTQRGRALLDAGHSVSRPQSAGQTVAEGRIDNRWS